MLKKPTVINRNLQPKEQLGDKVRTKQSRRSNPGVMCIAGSLFALALFLLPFLIERFYGYGKVSPALLVFGGVCGFTAFVGYIVALVFYVPLCLTVWRDSSRANWRLWAVGTVLLLAAGGSGFFRVLIQVILEL